MTWHNRIAPALLAAVLAPLAAPAIATTLTVTTTADEVAADGKCSLREALDNINHGDIFHDDCTGTGGNPYGTSDTIILPAGTYTMAIAGTGEDDNATGDYDIYASVAITGAGAATTRIHGNSLDRVFHVLPDSFGNPCAVSVSGVTITGGQESAFGAGVYNDIGTLTFTDASVSGNTGPDYGGGIYNNGGAVELVRSTVSNNAAGFAGGGICNTSTASRVGTLSLSRATVSGNSSGGRGGAISNDGDATISASTITGNSADANGGGISNDYSAWADGNLAISDSTLSANSANGAGGAISNTGTTLTVTNTTLSSNTSTGLAGGVYNQGILATTFTHVTFAGNTAVNEGDTLYVDGSEVTLSNALIANAGTSDDCFLSAGGTITSAGYNLDTDGTCFAEGGTDLVAVTTVNLGDLADNGGPTHTHALLAGSAAIDAGDCAGGSVGTDQRGVARPQGSACDIGAFELAPESGGGDTGGGDTGGGDTGGGDTGGGDTGGGGGAFNLPLLFVLGLAALTRRRSRR